MWFIIFLLVVIVSLIKKIRVTFTHGFCCGLFVFGTHFIWLSELLVNKSQASLGLAIAGYFLVVVYFSLTSGVLFWCIGYTELLLGGRYINILLLVGVYYYFIENWSLCIFGRSEGYPFLNPLIMFAQYKPIFKLVLWLVAKAGVLARWIFFGSALTLHPATSGDINFIYLPPVSVVQDNFVAAGQLVYHALSHLKISSGGYKGGMPLIIVTPETFYPFSLNLHPEQYKLWASVIPDGVSMIIGSQMRGLKFYQAAYLLRGGLINKYYVKRHCTPFVEKIPNLWKRLTFVRDLFLQNADEFSRGHQQLSDGVFEFGQVMLIPQICSEFFFKTTSKQVWDVCQQHLGINNTRKTAILFLVNDSWFMRYFKHILKVMTELKAAYLGIPVIYVGHQECLWV